MAASASTLEMTGVMASSGTVQTRKRKWPWIVAALLLFFSVVGACGDKEQSPGGSPEEPTAKEIPAGLAGMDAASARDRLQAMGFVVTVESVDGRAVIVESNWNVVSATLRDENTVLLQVAKPELTTTTTPAPVTVPTTAETPPVEVAPPPAPNPGPVEEPAPAPDAYYANCSEARAAGAAPLTAGEPGYRPALDRDHDGVACE